MKKPATIALEFERDELSELIKEKLDRYVRRSGMPLTITGIDFGEGEATMSFRTGRLLRREVD